MVLPAVPPLQARVWVRTIPSPNSVNFQSQSNWNPGISNADPNTGVGGYDIAPALSLPYGFKPVLQGTGDGQVAANFGAGYDAHWAGSGLGGSFIGAVPTGFNPGWKGDDGNPTFLDNTTALGTGALVYQNTATFPSAAGLMTTTGAGQREGAYYFETVNVGTDIFSTYLGSGVGVITPNQDLPFWFNGARRAGQPNAGILLGNTSSGFFQGFIKANNTQLGPSPNPQLSCDRWSVMCWAIAFRTAKIVQTEFFPVSMPCIPCCSPVCEPTILPPI